MLISGVTHLACHIRNRELRGEAKRNAFIADVIVGVACIAIALLAQKGKIPLSAELTKGLFVAGSIYSFANLFGAMDLHLSDRR